MKTAWQPAVAPGFLRGRSVRQVFRPVSDLFRQGTEPSKVALCVTLGVALSLFPVLGTTTLLCTAAAVLARVNLPAIQAVNWLMAGPHLLLIPVFLRIGERLAHAPPVSFDPGVWGHVLAASPSTFITRFGGAILHAVLGWAVAILPSAAVGQVVITKVLQARAHRFRRD